MTAHQPVHNFTGHYCANCGVAWDLDESEPDGDCTQGNPMSDITQTDPTQRMVGGTHYSKLSIQPVTYAMRNDLDFCAGSILKYLTRFRSKNGVEDLRKARHFVELREDSFKAAPWLKRPPKQNISIGEYVIANRIDGDDRRALLAFDFYLRDAFEDKGEYLLSRIDDLIAGYDSPLTHP